MAEINRIKQQTSKIILTNAIETAAVIIDEAHRSIFRKYRSIFAYFDAMLLGMTATPKSDVDKNTYEFFAVPDNTPTYNYPYRTAVDEDKVLVDYHCLEVKTKFLDEGIAYDDLSAEDKATYEETFGDEQRMRKMSYSA